MDRSESVVPVRVRGACVNSSDDGLACPAEAALFDPFGKFRFAPAKREIDAVKISPR